MLPLRSRRLVLFGAANTDNRLEMWLNYPKTRGMSGTTCSQQAGEGKGCRTAV